MSTPAHFSEARKSFHAALLGAVLRIDAGVLPAMQTAVARQVSGLPAAL